MPENYNLQNVSNLDYLHGLAKGNPDFVKEMIEIFLVDNFDEVQNLEKSIQLKDYSQIKDLAHKMRSTIAFVGIDQHIEKDLCEIEQLALGRSEIRNIEAIFLKIKQVCKKAAEELKSKME